jgi:hypothetical protein
MAAWEWVSATAGGARILRFGPSRPDFPERPSLRERKTAGMLSIRVLMVGTTAAPLVDQSLPSMAVCAALVDGALSLPQ